MRRQRLIKSLCTRTLVAFARVPLHDAFSPNSAAIRIRAPPGPGDILQRSPGLSYASISTSRSFTNVESESSKYAGHATEATTVVPLTSSAEVQRRDWLRGATQRLIESTPGTLVKGKWHELVSMMNAWSKRVRSDPTAPLNLERLLKRIIDERRAGNLEALSTTVLYSMVVDAWASSVETHGKAAARRARDILTVLQKTYEVEGDADRMPDAASFGAVLNAIARVESPLQARDYLFWMEGLYRMGRNSNALPSPRNYVTVLNAFADSAAEDAGIQAERILIHMHRTGVSPSTLCYNIAINAHVKSKKGRTTAEHCERILDYMDAEPDEYTLSSVLNAWATAGMKEFGAERAESILNKIEAERKIKPNVVVYNACLNAWCKSNSPVAADRTEALLHRMETSEDISPDLISYNTYLHALSRKGQVPGMARRADEMLCRMEERHDSGQMEFGPDSLSYNLVIEAYARCRERNSAERACEVLRKLVNREGVEPDTISFNQVISAIARSFMPGAAERAEELLQYMDRAFESGILNVRPDVVSYSSAITAWARSGAPGSAERAERLLNEMEERYLAGDKKCQPNIVAFNAVIDAWARSGEGTLGARRAESLLHRMQATRDRRLSPSIVTYNSLLNAWARSGTRCCAYKAELYLNRMWELYESGNKRVKPDDRSYNTVINAISKSKNEGKAQKALRILRQLDKLYKAGNIKACPTTTSYTAVLNSCAFPAVTDAKSRRKALDTAIFTLEELQGSEYGNPNSITYGMFFKACANLLPRDDELRRMIVEPVFRKACQDGQVGEMVLAHFRLAAPRDLYEELLGGLRPAKGRKVTFHDLPAEWRRNVEAHRRWTTQTQLLVRNKKHSKRKATKRIRPRHF